MKDTFKIYIITNPRGESYIGCTLNFNKRMLTYKNTTCYDQKKIYNSLVEFGFKNHSVKIIDEAVDLHEGFIKESFYIYKYKSIKNGLNVNLPNKPSDKVSFNKKEGNVLIRYTTKYQLKFANNYTWSKCGKCFNSKTGKQIKQCYKNGMIGYYIRSKFYSLKYLKTQLERIPKVECPF